MSVDWDKPLQVYQRDRWHDAAAVVVSKKDPDYAYVVIHLDDGTVSGDLYDSAWMNIRNTPAPPTYRAWKNVTEMGDAVNHWFRLKNHRFWRGIQVVDPDSAIVVRLDNDWHRLSELFIRYQHSPTPWIEGSWEPCGVKE